MRSPDRIGRATALAFLLCVALGTFAARAASPEPVHPRVVSLNPSLTAILLAIDAGPHLVGVDDWSARDLSEVADLPRVGGLFNPSVEAILALEPDVVVWVPSAQQRSLRERLESLGVEVMELENFTLDQVLSGIERLGERVGRGDAARRRVARIRAAWEQSRDAARDRAHPRTVMVLQRDPLYVVGRGSFLNAMMEAAGSENLAAGFEDPYPRVGVEWLIAAGPELILDAAPDAGGADAYWSRWPSLAESRDGVVKVPADLVTLPGPHLDRAVDWLSSSIADVLARRSADGS